MEEGIVSANRRQTAHEQSRRRQDWVVAVVAIGVGGMVGGGIFAVLGLAVQLAQGGTPVAFALAGAVALLTTYSYAKLSVAYPSRGGTVTFLDRTFGAGMFTGSMNVLLWLSYVVMLSLYAFAFGSYGATFLPELWQASGKHALICLSVIMITGLNLLSAELIGKAEVWIVGLKVAILLFFVGAGLAGVKTSQIVPGSWSPSLQLAAGGMIIFVAYEGFELIANTAHDVRNAARTLPRAYYTAVGFVIGLYVLVALVTVGNLTVDKIVAARDYALAEAARPFLGQAGFTLIAVAAMLSTASAINATLYGAARLSYCIARDGELPAILERKVWGEPLEGLLITGGLTLFVANTFDLTQYLDAGQRRVSVDLRGSQHRQCVSRSLTPTAAAGFQRPGPLRAWRRWARWFGRRRSPHPQSYGCWRRWLPWQC